MRENDVNVLFIVSVLFSQFSFHQNLFQNENLNVCSSLALHQKERYLSSFYSEDFVIKNTLSSGKAVNNLFSLLSSSFNDE